MPVRARIKVGDVFAIPLGEGAYALAACTFVFRHFKNGIACRVYDAVVEAPKMIEPMPNKIAFDPLFMGKQIITAGTWLIVGKVSPDIAPVVFRVAVGKYVGDNYVGLAGDEELPEMRAHGPVAVQIVLRRHFKLP
jgi:hypothetical protein